MSSHAYNNHQTEDPHVNFEEYNELKTLLIKRRKCAKCYSWCLILLVLLASTVIAFKLSFRLMGNYHHENRNYHHENRYNDNQQNSVNLQKIKISKRFSGLNNNQEMPYTENVNTNMNKVINFHDKVSKYFMNRFDQDFNNNNVYSMINEINTPPGRGLRRHHNKHGRVGGKFHHYIKLFRIVMIIRGVILLILGLITGIKGYLATKHIDIKQARKFKNLNTCLIVYKIVEFIIVLSIISFVTIKYNIEHEFMITLNSETICQVLIGLLILLIIIFITQFCLVIPRNFYNSLVMAQGRLGNLAYIAMRNELLGKPVESNRIKNSTKSNKISQNNIPIYYPNNVPFRPFYHTPYPSGQQNQQINRRQPFATKFNNNVSNNNYSPDSVYRINSCSSSINDNYNQQYPIKLPVTNNVHGTQQAPYYVKNYDNAVGLNQNHIFDHNEVNFNNLNAHMGNKAADTSKLNENRATETDGNLYPSMKY